MENTNSAKIIGIIYIKNKGYYRPWDMAEVPVGSVIKSYLSGIKTIIVACGDDKMKIKHIWTGGREYGYSPIDILKNFTLNGEPCGVKIAKDDAK